MHSLSRLHSLRFPGRMQTPGRILGSACMLLATGGTFQSCSHQLLPPNPKQLESRLQGRGQLWQLLSKARVRSVYITTLWKKYNLFINTTYWEIFLLKHFCLFLFNLMTVLKGSQRQNQKNLRECPRLPVCSGVLMFLGEKIVKNLGNLEKTWGSGEECCFSVGEVIF